jgi:hypothetical protein
MSRAHLSSLALFVLCGMFASNAGAISLTGSGTAGTITQWTGTFSLGNSVMTQYNSPTGNGMYVGINTATPFGSLGIESHGGYEIFGSGLAYPFHHFNIASNNSMHLTSGLKVDGTTQDPLASLGLGAGGASELVVLQRKQFSVASTVGMALGALPDTEFTTGYRLKVNGKIRAKEVKVDVNWSDFVFAPDYALPSLDALESQISTIGHLPGIPSTEDAERDGVSVGEMESRLLQKVEELTLYVIQLNKENRELRARLDRAAR